MNNDQLANLYRTMLAARFIDAVEEERTRGGEAFFHVSGAGHEGSAVLANHLSDQDWLHCHYRDKALMLARGIPIRDFFDSLYCKGQSHSLGRQMSAHMCDASRKVLSIVGPVGNSALQAVGIAAATKHRPERPVTLCSVGDGTTQQGEYLEACGEAARENAPVLFFVEDNEWAISTTTREKTFYSSSSGKLREFHGLPIHFVDGRDPVSADRELGPIVQAVRDGRPQIVVFEVDRLSNHTNADDQTIYRDDDAIRAAAEHGDPIRNLEKTLLANGWTDDDLSRVRAEVQAEVNDADEQAAFGPEPIAVHTAKQPVPVELTHASHERPGDDSEPRLNMREALGKTLDHYLETDPR
ncbi:MAG: thiamine pyrophosphate-dependent dehydrogenase E1 component subunit alpha, partial [Planctomycetales bacterium]